MKNMIVTSFGIISLLASCKEAVSEVYEDPPQAAKVGMKAPDFQFQDMASGSDSKLSDLWGKVVVLNFWWSGCARSEPVMLELQKKISEQKSRWGSEVSFLTVGVDMTLAEGKGHADSKGWSQTRNGWIEPKTNLAYQSYLTMQGRGTPATYIIGRGGLIRATILASDYGIKADPILKFESAWKKISNELDKGVAPQS